MQSLCASTGSKWITDKPNYPGDLFNNSGCYWPVPDYTQDYWKLQHTAAEKFTYGRSNAKYAYREQAMFYYAASSGRDLIPELMLYPERVIEHARRFTDDKDTPYLTVRRAADVLDPERMQNIFALNYQRNAAEAAVAAHHMRDTYIIAPAHREQMLRSLSSKHSILRGVGFEDAVFEKHLWGPLCLFDATKGIYGGNAAWSFNAPMEKALGAAIQYGVAVPLQARQGASFDVTDIWNRPVSVVDQACEDARGIVDVVGTKVKLRDGAEVRFRFETAVALLLTRFMYDDMYRKGDPALESDHAHPIVKAHYANDEDQRRFVQLKEIMLPYMAEFCNWPTLRRILNHDPALKDYWDEHVVPSRKNLRPEAEIEAAILGYLPRGGYDNAALRAKVQERRDAPKTLQFAMQSLPQMSHGQHIDPFDGKQDPQFFNDRNFARLGGTSSPQDEPDPDHYTRGQAAAVMTLAEFLHDGLPPANAPRTVLYVDDVTGGARAANFREKQKIDNLGEQSSIIDPLADGGSSYAEDVAAETSAELSDRVRMLALGNESADWRKTYNIGNVVPSSDVRASLGMYAGYREGTKTMFHWALAAKGPLKLGGDVEQTIVRRWIDLELNGMVLTPGDVSNNSCRYIAEGVLVATGLTKRTHEGARYQFEFFMDDDDSVAVTRRGAPRKLDLADLIIHVGMKTKQDLDMLHPPKNRDQYVTMARLLQTYEMLIDPVNCNTVIKRDEHSGKDTKASIVDWNQVDPAFIGFAAHQPNPAVFALTDIKERGDRPDYDAFVKDPDYQAFLKNKLDVAALIEDPAQKAKLAHMIWFYMRVDMAVPPQKKVPVIGHLLIKGIQAFDRDDTINLPPEYQKARDWWHNLSAKQKANIFEQKTLFINGPAVAVP
jgi:hypothetical protein